MSFADTSGGSFAFIEETEWGTTPATPAWQRLRINSESLTNAIQTQISQELKVSAAVGDLVRVGASINGDVTQHLSWGTADTKVMLAQAMRGAWAAAASGTFSADWQAADSSVNRIDGGSFRMEGFVKGDSITVTGATTNTGPFTVNEATKSKLTFNEAVVDEGPLDCTLTGTSLTVLKRGLLRPSMSMERRIDLTASQLYARFSGCRLGGVNMTFQNGQISGMNFNTIGRNEVTDTAIVAGATYLPPNAANIMAAPDASNIQIEGITGTRSYTTLNYNMIHNLRPQQELGSLYLAGVGYGQTQLTGQLVIYKIDNEVYDLFPAGTRSELAWETTDGTTKLSFAMPFKFTSGQNNLAGVNQDVFDTMGFQALENQIAGTEFTIVEGEFS